MSSIFLDSEIRSASAVLFVQGIPLRIPQQDLGSSVYHRGHARFSRENKPIRASRGFLSVEHPRWNRNTVPSSLPTKVDLHVHDITRARSKRNSKPRSKSAPLDYSSLQLPEDFHIPF